MAHCPILLASSSRYRRELLERPGFPFSYASPHINEAPEPGETATQVALRLAENKARALASRFPGHWVIGSDQVACLPDGSFLGKPGNHEQAVVQLRRSSGQNVSFITGLALLDTTSGQIQTHCEPFSVQFRHLSSDEIEAYLKKEQPYDCAGSFRVEGAGIALFTRMEGRDPNSLIGLPLIALNDMLRNWGRNPLLEP